MGRRLTGTAGEADTSGLALLRGAADALGRSRTGAHTLLLCMLVACAYLTGARLGLALAFATEPAAAISLPTGIALAALITFGYRVWPGIYSAAVLANAMAHESVTAAIFIAAANTATGLVGLAALRASSFQATLERGRDVVVLLAVGIGSTVLSATFETGVLVFDTRITWSESVSAWCAWWAADSLGILIVTPAILTLLHHSGIHWTPARLAELASYLTLTLLIGLVVFVLPSGSNPLFYPRAYVSFPLLAWAGLRFGARETSFGVAIIAGLAVWGSVHGHGPFTREPLDTRLILLDVFIATVGCTALLIAAVTAERQGARVAAKESESLLHAITLHTPAVIYVKDLQGRYLMVNRQYEELWGMPNDLVRGKSDHDVFPEQEAERFRAMDERVIRAGHALTEEEIASRQDGLHTYVSVKFPLRHDGGETYAVVGISTDITQLHQAQARLREAYEELEERVRERTAELAAVVNELRQRNLEKETLLREIHHRVKNNLQVICSLLNLQSDQHEDSQLVAFAQDCNARVRSMALVHEHLYQSNDLQSVPLALYMGSLVEEIVRAQPVSARVECRLAIQEITLPVDQAITCGLMVNELVTNALKHGFPGGRSGEIRVAIAEDPADRIELTVSDDGVGMPRDFDSSRSGGFGLSLVSMLADQLNANIKMEGGRGTRVRVCFSRRVSGSARS